jgi:dynein heavy chain
VNTEGLNEQLLSVIVKEESPADESEKNNILQKKFQLNETVHKTEEDILQKLSVSSEELLESDGLIFSLEESKKLSDEANQQIRNAKITEERIDNNRLLYLPLAKLSTMIFFAINELNNLEEIYQFSISWYIKDILINSIKQNDYDKNAVTIKTKEFILDRLKILTESLLKTSFIAVCRSLLNKDKLVFSMILLLRKLISDGEITKEESEFFLGNEDFIVMKEENEKLKHIKQNLFEQNVWEKLCICNNLENMQNICEEIINNIENWRNFINNVINNNEIEYEQHFNFPIKEKEKENDSENEENQKLSLFHKLIILKIINPEYLLPYSRIVISKYLGPELSNIPLFTIEDLYEISSFNTPLMLIVAAGLEPTNDVKKLAEDNNKELVSVSLGQGQSEKALASIEECQKRVNGCFYRIYI